MFLSDNLQCWMWIFKEGIGTKAVIQSHIYLHQWFQHFFKIIGDTIPKEDTQQLLKELADPEDEDGFFPYTPFLDRLVGKA